MAENKWFLTVDDDGCACEIFNQLNKPRKDRRGMYPSGIFTFDSEALRKLPERVKIKRGECIEIEPLEIKAKQ